MAKRLGLIAAWLVATAVATVVTMTAVSLVGASVLEQPSAAFVTTTTDVPPGVVETAPETVVSTTLAPTDPTLTSSTAAATTTSTSAGVTTTTVGPTTTTVISATTTTSQPTTTTTGPSTTTTTVAETTGPFTFPVEGGSVTVTCQVDAISLSGAVPNTGYAVEVEKTGPDEVRVDFILGEEDEIEVRIECEDGVPEIEIDD